VSKEHRRPVVAGMLAVACFGIGGALGAGVGSALGASTSVLLLLLLVGHALGYLAARRALRWLFVRWA
jgi:hypothetical protein